jgi:hypothetical protein
MASRASFEPDFDLSLWPVVQFFLPEEIDAACMERILDTFDAIYRTRERFVALADARRVRALPDPRVRRRVGEWANAGHELSYRYCVGRVNVASSPLVRGGITAINWLWKPPQPELVVGSLSEGLRRSAGLLARAGVEVPERLRAVPVT